MDIKKIERLKSEGWTEYEPKFKLKVIDENDNEVEQPPTKQIYKKEGGFVHIKGFIDLKPMP